MTGDFLIKRIITLIFAFILIFNIEAAALSNITLKPDGEFYIYGENNGEISELLGLKENELPDYCKDNNIVFLAANKDNSKQIRVDCYSTEFSENVVNISALPDDKIMQLSADIIGLEDVKSVIITKDGQKFIKTELMSEDSGGKYSVTQYITVANKKNYILNFYTDAKQDDKYIEKSFESYWCDDFFAQQSKTQSGLRYIILIASILFAIAAVGVTVSVILEIKKEKTIDNNDTSNQ